MVLHGCRCRWQRSATLLFGHGAAASQPCAHGANHAACERAGQARTQERQVAGAVQLCARRYSLQQGPVEEQRQTHNRSCAARQQQRSAQQACAWGSTLTWQCGAHSRSAAGVLLWQCEASERERAKRFKRQKRLPASKGYSTYLYISYATAPVVRR